MFRFLKKSTLPAGLLLTSLLCYASVLISPEFFWPSSLLSYFTPLCIAANICLLLYYSFRRKRRAVFPFIALLIGLPFLSRSFNLVTSKPENSDFSILSYNTKLFRAEDTYDQFSREMIDWVINDTSSIKCIQEFCTNKEWPGLDIYGDIESKGYNGYSFKSKTMHSSGLAIFSKFPIVASGTLFDRSQTVNNIIYTDLKIKDDTLRVYNCHLSSMSILLYEYKTLEQSSNKFKKLINKLRSGGISRSKEIKTLLDHADKAPHPVLICGDFNEIPYSYNYFKFGEVYKNSFEESGKGFGFTLNNALFFLRIDHQFYGEGIEVDQYLVDRSMKVSDHFATRAWYQLH